jgi:ABC-2 type transport system permease protein
VFGLVLPLLTTMFFYFAFGGAGGDEAIVGLPDAVDVQVVNLDAPDSSLGVPPLGELLVDSLEGMENILEVAISADATEARNAVDDQQAAVAVIIPENFTAAMVEEGERATVELYQDPTLTIGPAIVSSIVEQLVDGFTGARIAVSVAFDQLISAGVTVDAALAQEVAAGYTNWAMAFGEDQEVDVSPYLDVQSTSEVEEEATDLTAQMLNLIMTAMMTFYVFFTGAASAQSILLEEEDGTLPRLFTTPTTQATILGGKMVANFVTLIAQAVFLVIFSSLVFDVRWGQLPSIMLAILGLVVLSGSFGLFLTSWLKDTRQSGIVYGGVLTVIGMVGISKVFTASVPGSGAAKTTSIISLLTPHGWALRAWETSMGGGGVVDMLLPVGVMLALGAAFFAWGVLRFRKRFN